MPKIQSWEVSDVFWEKVEPLIPLPKRDPNKEYKRKPGGGRKPMPHPCIHLSGDSSRRALSLNLGA